MGCEHVKSLKKVEPRTTGCEECLRIGQRWVSLRLCQSCGHVGCCDSSPGRHATAHFQKIRHPVMRAFGEGDWGWCYVDEETLTNTAFTLEGPEGRRLSTSVPLLGAYNAANAALAIVMLVESGYDLEAIGAALERDGGIDAYVPGRTERISGDRGPVVFIDYGHSPDAFLSTLNALRKVTEGRIVMVFGADGDRDTTKRTDMGAIAARGADAVVITDFHPRWEDPASIRAALLEGARSAVPDGELYEVPDPRAAFRKALSLAGEDDVVLYAGPGHEDYQEVAGQRLPYSARDDVKLALREAGRL